MAINSIGFNNSIFGQAVQNLNNQLTNLSTQLATGEKSTTYSGVGPNEGFAIAARSQLSNISAFTGTITNVSTSINAANTVLQSLSKISSTVQGDAASTPQDLNSSGQTIGQQNALTEFSSTVGILNTQAGDRFLFSGSAINTPPVAASDTILNGTGTQAGLKQVIAERAQADGTTGLGRLVISSPTTSGVPATTSFSVAEDAAGSPFGLKLSSVSSTLTGATVTGPSGSPAAVSFSFGSTNPNPGDQVTVNFNLPDGTSEFVKLTASNSTAAPANTFAIGSTPAQTAANLNAALNTAIGTLANTSLVGASAVAAGNDFFDPSSSATGAAATNQQTPPQAITSATALTGGAGTNSLSAAFADGDTITVNGTSISFSATVPTSASGSPYVINTTSGTVGNLLSAIDSITGTTAPSSIDGGAVTVNTPSAANFSISASSSTAKNALAALGFSQAAGTATTNASGTTTVTAPQPPLRVSNSGSVTGAVAVNQGLPASAGPPPVAAVPPAPITGATALSGTAADSLAKGFQSSDTITVDGTVINFSNASNTFPAGQAATLTGTGLATGATPGFTDTGSGVSFTVQVGSGPATTVTLSDTPSGTATTFTATQIEQAINTANGGNPIAGVTAAVSNGQVVLTSTATGSSASVTVGGANGAAIFGAGNTTASGTAPTPFTTTAGNPPTLSLNPGDTAGTLLAAIDSITGGTSSINGGAVTINTPNAANFSITALSSDPNAQAALAALGFSSASGTATTTAGGTNITASATSLVNGSANTVAWYTGNNSSNPRGSSTARIDSGITVDYGAQANEQAIRQQIEGIAVYAAVSFSPTATNSPAQASALSSRIAANLTSKPGQQTISDIQTDFAAAQTQIQDATARQTQTQSLLQNLVDSTETVSTEQVASEILQLQTTLSASYQTTSILAGLSLTKFLAPGG